MKRILPDGAFAKEPFAATGVYEQLIVREFMLGLNRLTDQEWPG